MGNLQRLLKAVKVLAGGQGSGFPKGAKPIQSFPEKASGQPENKGEPQGSWSDTGKKKAYIVQVGDTKYLTAAHSKAHAINQAKTHAKTLGQPVGQAYPSRMGLKVQDMVGKKLPVKGNDGITFKWMDGHLVPVKINKGGKTALTSSQGA